MPIPTRSAHQQRAVARKRRKLVWSSCWRLAAGLSGVAALCLATPATSFAQATPAKVNPGELLDLSPKAWAAEAAKNELSVVQYNGVYLRYRIHMVGARGDQVRDVIESKDGTVARLILKDNRPLTVEEDAAERERLQAMLDSPSAFAKHIKSDQSGKKLAVDLLQMMPDAMLFTYAPGQPQRSHPEAHPGDPPEVVIDFKPNPAWNPPSMTAEALTGLQGRAWIDPKSKHVTRMEGNIFRGVNLGWGMVAHINPGGTLELEQVRAANQRWIFFHFVEHVTVRALLVKTFNENSQIDSSNFTQISPLPYQEAIKLLLQAPLPH